MSDRKTFSDSVTALPDQDSGKAMGLVMNAAKPDDLNERMNLFFSLEMPSKDDLESRVAKGEIISPDQLAKDYAPKSSDIDNLTTWLTQQGFQVGGQSPDGLGVYASAPVSQIEKSLAVDMVRVTKDGITYAAAKNAPSLPADIGGPVHAIVGLQPFRHPNKRMARAMPPRHRPALDAGGPPAPGAANAANAPPYHVSAILKAYGASDLGVTGEGQTIAILIDTLPNDADLTAFWSANGVNPSLARIKKINLSAGPLPAVEGEETLDASWASGVAPDATINIYATGSLGFVDLDQGLDRIFTDASADPTLRQLSISLGLGEHYMPAGEIDAQHQKYLKLAAIGVNVFVSSGDAGSNPGPDGHNSNGPLQAEYGASDPAVVGVGGTSLKLNPDGSVAEEDAWSGSGGGASRTFPRPPWQTGLGIPSANHRYVPDVGLAADPNEGAFLVLNGKPMQIGGTSWSAPMWAGFCALINEARQKKGLSSLPFLNPLLYPLLGTPCFRDITSGSNGKFRAGPGYDEITGLGAPDVGALLQRLVAPQAAAVAEVPAAARRSATG